MAIPVMWRTKKARYSLQSDVCPACARLVFPPRRVCPYCGRDAQEEALQAQELRYEFAFFPSPSVELRAVGDD